MYRTFGPAHLKSLQDWQDLDRTIMFITTAVWGNMVNLHLKSNILLKRAIFFLFWWKSTWHSDWEAINIYQTPIIFSGLWLGLVTFLMSAMMPFYNIKAARQNLAFIVFPPWVSLLHPLWYSLACKHVSITMSYASSPLKMFSENTCWPHLLKPASKVAIGAFWPTLKASMDFCH